MSRERPVSEVQRDCIIAATIEPLTPYRRGYARSRQGPFYGLQTVNKLIRTGALRMIKHRAGRRPGTVTARDA
jgi:hypothetical protein